MGEVGGFTAANIEADQSRQEEALADKLKGAQDFSKLEADIEARKQDAATVNPRPLLEYGAPSGPTRRLGQSGV